VSGALSTHAAVLAQRFLAGLGPPAPPVLYAALGTLSNGAFVELAASDYARQLYTPAVDGAGVMSNTLGITFGPNTVIAWGTITALALYDAATGGNLVWSGLAATPQSIVLGDSGTILAGAFTTALPG
jgi:hypothetical protein